MKEFCQDDWKPCSKFVEGTNYRVPGLRENKKYLFRVFAESVHGKISEALEIDEAVVARNPFSKMSSIVWFQMYNVTRRLQSCKAKLLALFDIMRNVPNCHSCQNDILQKCLLVTNYFALRCSLNTIIF